MPFGLTGIAAKILIYVGVLLAGLAAGAYGMHKMDNAAYEALELQYKDAQVKAVQLAQQQQRDLDNIAVQAAQQEAQTQAALTAKAQQQLASVSKHVTTTTANSCVTYGLIRVIDASVNGVLADSLNLPAGKSDSSCAPVSAASLARSVVSNYNNANANKAQLDAFIKYLRQVQAAQDKQTQTTK